jgi:hypothetical protein
MDGYLEAAASGQEETVAASTKLPNSSPWKLAKLALALARGSLIPMSAMSGYTAYD